MGANTTFDRLETKRTLVRTKTTRPEAEATGQPHHLVRLPKGAKPVTVSLTPWQGFSWRRFGAFVQARGREDPEL